MSSGTTAGKARGAALLPTSQRHTVKQLALRAITLLPDDAAVDDVIEQVQFIIGVLAGIAEADAGRLISSEVVEEEMQTWFG